MPASRYHVPNLDRALDILELLAKRPGGLNRADIAAATKLSSNMVYRITMTLEERGYLHRDDADKRYQLTKKLLNIGRESLDDYSLAERAWDEMVQLRDAQGETVQLSVLAGAEGVILERVLGTHAVCILIQRGIRFPLHNNAPGKILVSGLAPGCRERLIKKMVFEATTERTISSAKAYRAELEKIARCGYALDVGECMHGVHCVAAAIRDADGATAGALCITGHADRFPEGQLPRCAEQVIASAERISHRLGYRKPKIAVLGGRA